MRIKRIELNGFKSFLERTVLELPLGVTAIVGPNGCGKSNIVDAIRWVLGEQSPKHLRGEAMEDVIFTGNGESGPLGMAEVTLLLERDERDLERRAADASDGVEEALPAALAEASEIAVTRRYFRSGESEYFINRVPCRLRDITELFLGTGVGTKAYAIIEQGRVEQLVNAKPEEVRLFIEEAAGTTRFRSRKLAAERKMERTRENLVRVEDVLRELERQMASLERQARRAEEYHRIKDGLRALDLRVLAARQRAWSDEMRTLGERLAAVREEEARLQEAIRRARSATTEARARRSSDEERLRICDAEIAEHRLRAGEARTLAAALATRETELRMRTADAEREVAALRLRLDDLETESTGLDAALERAATEATEAESRRLDAEARLRALEAEGPPLEQTLELLKDAVVEASAEEARLHNLADVLRQRHEDLEGRRRKLEDERRLLGERLRANAHDTETAREAIASCERNLGGLAAEREALTARQVEFAGEEATRRAALEAAREAARRAGSRADSLRELQSRHEGCKRGAAGLLAREPGTAALLASVLRVPAALERAVAAALGARLGHIVVPDTPSALAAVAWLRDSLAGSATVLPRDAERRAAVIVPAGRRLLDQIDVDPQHWALAEALLGQVLLAENLDQALELWRAASHPVTVVTPAGEGIDTLGAVSGGSEPPLEETLLARTRELRDLEGAVAAARNALAREESLLADVETRVAELSVASRAADERLQALRLQLVAAEKDRERLEEERGRLAAELEVEALEASGLAGEGGHVAEEIAALGARRERAAQTLADRRRDLADRQQALTAWRETHAVAERARTDAAVRLAAAAERRRSFETAAARSRAAVVDVHERLASLTQRAAEAASGAEAAAAEAGASETARAAAEERAAALTLERDRLRQAIAEADAALTSDDAAEAGSRERLDALAQDRAGADVTLAERRLGLEHLAAQLAERYGLGLDALADVVVEDDGQDAERADHAEALRARLARLGDVNPAAAGELEELRTRREFLVAQRTDLDSSLDDLRRTIAKLNRTSRQRFEETFTAANEKLAEVFPKLFPNGKAQLELVPPEEGGEPGIEIVVQPAGKKLQSLSLLSGGEKALTATALILSLFLIRPTPFCLLDEVDAPLDEANIGRFNQLVRDMATTSQFVLITHNRRTMEVADTLYGITMERAGISKVVAVRLREAA